MKSEQININSIKINTNGIGTNSAKMNITDVFAEKVGSYLNGFNLFLAHFNTIPNFIHEIDIDCKKANQWFLETYQSDIKDLHYDKRYFKRSKRAELDDIFYMLFDDLLLDFDTNNYLVRFYFRSTDTKIVDEIINGIHQFKLRKKKHKPDIYLLCNSPKGITYSSFKVTKPKLSLEDNYNDDFKEIHQTIFKRLSKKDDKGLILLHGKPGTGKTSYIRYLISTVKKNVIFLPPNLAGDITNPGLMSILIDNPNSIFVIEDAENIVVDRDKDGRSPVSTLLNISDGLLSDCLNIQIICSFNTDISKIDSALLRKGRLIAKYEFNELETPKAKQLSQKLGFKTSVETPMTLTAIYNQEETDFLQTNKKNPIGFNLK